jgi:pilus assembly protein CpaB
VNRRLLTILLAALVISLIASYLVYRVAGGQMRANTKPNTTPVVVAARDLEIGTLLKDGDFKMGSVTGTPPKGSVVKTDGLPGRGVVSMIYQGEPLLESRLAAPGSGGGLAATIPPGMRACAVKVNDVVGVAGFVTPGMRVDVLISGNAPGGNATDGTKVRTLLQNIQVLSAGTNIQKDNEGKAVPVAVVNLLVTPEQAEVLSLASGEARIQLVLRNPLDTVVANTSGSNTSAIFSDKGKAPATPAAAHPSGTPRVATRRVAAVAPPKPVVPPAQTYSVEIYNGGKRTESKFESKADAKNNDGKSEPKQEKP